MAAIHLRTPALIAAHLMALPARYQIGKWNNIPLSTMLAFNVMNIGLILLARAVANDIIKRTKWEFSDQQDDVLVIANRVLTCLAAWYATSRLKEPIPLLYAGLLSISAAVSIVFSVGLAEYIYKRIDERIHIEHIRGDE